MMMIFDAQSVRGPVADGNGGHFQRSVCVPAHFGPERHPGRDPSAVASGTRQQSGPAPCGPMGGSQRR